MGNMVTLPNQSVKPSAKKTKLKHEENAIIEHTHCHNCNVKPFELGSALSALAFFVCGDFACDYIYICLTSTG